MKKNQMIKRVVFAFSGFMITRKAGTPGAKLYRKCYLELLRMPYKRILK